MWRVSPVKSGSSLRPAILLFLSIVIQLAHAEDESMGPIFIKEPPNRVDFSNGTGAVIECQARGNPQPDIIWIRADGTAVGDVPGLRQVLPNGNLVFPPFRAEDYRQEVHAQVYICLARNTVGSIHSRDVNVRAVVTQAYHPEIMTEYVIRGNSAILKCSIPSYVAEFVTVEAWISEDGETYLPRLRTNDSDGKYLVLPSGELHIKDVGPEDGYKTYQCRTKHRLTGETRLSATKGRLVITEPVGSVRPKFPNLENLIGISTAASKSIRLLCPGQGFPVPSHRWYKFIEGTSRRQPVQLNERVRQVSGTLIILEAQVDDSGKYLCVVNNSVGGESVETVLTVTAPLAAEIEPRSQIIDFGRPATFTCNTKGNPIKTVSWLKDGKPIGHEDTTLKIESVKKDDKGMYQCFIRNDQESAQASAELKLGGRFEPPQIRSAFHEETLQPGPSVHLKCTASGNPTPEITWELDGKKLSNTERFQVGQYVTVNGDVVSNLNISSIHTNDGGLYKCIASSKVGSAEHSARLNVYGLPFIRHMDKKAIVAGETLRVTCPVAGHPIESIVWERDTRVLPINRKQKVFQNGTLIIENVERMTDQATYTCVARNAQGYSARGTLEVQVMVAPQIVPFSFSDRPANSGESMSATCSVSTGDFPLAITWYFDGQKLTESLLDDVVVSTSKRRSLLEIESVGAHHAGSYKCSVENDAGTATHTAVLIVNAAPQIVPFSFADRAVNSGESISATCSVSVGDNPLEFSWFFNGEPIDTTARPDISITYNKRRSALDIESVTADNSGEYTCTVSNKAGATSHSTALVVNAPPQIAPFTMGLEAANWGEQISATCSVLKGDNPIEIQWSLNGRIINEADHPDIVITKSGRKISLLVIDSVKAHHAGEYICTASNLAGSSSHSAVLSVNVAPQIGSFSFGDEPLNAGETASLTCIVAKGDFPLEIIWMFNGAPIDPNVKEIIVSETGKRTKQLTIDSVGAQHAGEYTCVASNVAGSTTRSAALVVNVAPQIGIGFTFGEEPLNAGDMATVTCAVIKGDSPLDIGIMFDGKPIEEQEKSGILIANSGKRAKQLTIEAVEARHAGEYTCVASNLAGATSRSALLAVNVPPQITPFSIDEGPVNWGEQVSLFCSVLKGDRPMKIHWQLNGEIIDPKKSHVDGVAITKTGKMISVLSIDSVAAHHAGNYSCVASNAAGQAQLTTRLSVNVSKILVAFNSKLPDSKYPQVRIAPQIKTFSFGDEPLNAGETTSIQCVITKGDFPLDISFMFKGSPIVPGGDTIISETGKRAKQLMIDSVSARHVGEYTCVASNVAGSTSHSAYLEVNVPPQIGTFSFGEEPLNAGDTASVQCVVMKGDFPLDISFTFQCKAVESDDGIVVSVTGKRAKQLMLDSVSAKHAGEYTCIASNVAGTTTRSTLLAVNVAPQIGMFSFGDEPLNAGDMASVQCAVMKGDFPLDISFMFKNEPIVSSDEVVISENGKRIKQLMIDSVNARHAGEYTCIASNVAGSTSRTAMLAVNVPPQIGSFSFGTGAESLNAGDIASVTCAVTKGDLPMDIQWMFQNQPIDVTREDVVVTNLGKRGKQLSIESVGAEHAGEYTCVASNVAGATTRTAVLEVNVSPQIGAFTFGTEPVNAGDVASVTCVVTKGDFPMDIQWMFQNQPIGTEREDIMVSNFGKRGKQLTIESVGARHAGEYTCVASNVAGSTTRTAVLDVNVAPQIGAFTFGTEPINAGDVASVTCVVIKGDFPMEIQWMFKSQPIDVKREDIVISNVGKRGKQLSIESVGASHAGEYTCVASNVAGSTSRSAVLDVNVAPQISAISFGDEPVNAGDIVSVLCTVTKGDFPLEIQWMFKGQPLLPTAGDVVISDSGKRGKQLTIEAVRAEHMGEYTCVASNVAGSTTRSAVLDVNVLPRLLPFSLGDGPLNSGQVVTVPCAVVEGDVPLKLSWTLNGQPISPHSGISVLDLGERGAILSIGSVQASHAGNYTCTAENPAGKHELSAELIVNVHPRIVPFDFGNEQIYAGQTAQLACMVQVGDTPIDIYWTYEGRRLRPESEAGLRVGQVGPRTSVLSIDPVESSHGGGYACVASNASGNDTHRATLRVHG
ncbi:hemicentin-2-like [Trichogramma pretiosum]|uniref:hemicentin-2-like n=1 Tax=Trichogramma pretiosum TaxID=7493 RepID=UPI000C7198CC|nr:hemicentin-2-like [Trichogramma pretiosum]